MRPACSASASSRLKEGRPNVVDLIKSDRIQLILNTPRGQDTFFDEKAIRRAAVLARIPTITTLAAAQAAAEGIAALQRGHRSTSTPCKPCTRSVKVRRHNSCLQARRDVNVLLQNGRDPVPVLPGAGLAGGR